jgi:uncharacterized protein
MLKNSQKYYPTTIEAIHLLVLYLFLQALVDFPLALLDYINDSNWSNNPYISIISSVSITLFIFIYGFRNANAKFTEVFAIKAFNPLLLIPIIILLPGLQFLVGLLNSEVANILPAPPWFWELFERVLENRYGFWGTLVRVAVVAPIVEETLFRGIIMYGLMRNYRGWYAVLLSGILFSCFHLNPWQMTYTFFLGLLLGFVVVRTRSLPLSILVHAINNLIVLLAITYQKEIGASFISTLSDIQNIVISSVAVVLGISLIFFITRKRKY